MTEKHFDFQFRSCYKTIVPYIGTLHPGKGNPVRIGSGPAAVIPALLKDRVKAFTEERHWPCIWAGKAGRGGRARKPVRMFSHSLRP